jgi:hypothetical protein
MMHLLLILLLASTCLASGKYREQLDVILRPDSVYWETVEVLYEGKSVEQYFPYEKAPDEVFMIVPVCNGPTSHDWRYGDEYLYRPESTYEYVQYDRVAHRNRICRNCLRHEKQIKRIWTPPPQVSEYDSLLNILKEMQR